MFEHTEQQGRSGCPETSVEASLSAMFAVRSTVTVLIDDCIVILKHQNAFGFRYDAIITDPPYEIGLHGKAWDHTGISFTPMLWGLLFEILKPGGFVAAFSSARLYHRLAIAAEDAGFMLYPFLSWTYANGLPKPTNVSELFDRANLAERVIIGSRAGSGYTRANVSQGLQNRRSIQFPMYERHVSQEAKDWRGFYYGMTCFSPSAEPILLAQKPIDRTSMIENLRVWGTGALNLGAMKHRYGAWPTTVLHHDRTRGSGHLAVKPVGLMEDLCLLLCPPNGSILDPFAGTGTTGVAALQHGFNCTLIEREPLLEAVIKRRLRSAIPV